MWCTCGLKKVTHRVIGQVKQDRENLTAFDPRRHVAIAHDTAPRLSRCGLKLDDGRLQAVGVLESVGVGIRCLTAQVVGRGKHVAVRGPWPV